MFCTDIPNPFLFIFSSSVPQLLYYSHIPTVIVALGIGFFVYFKNKQSLISKLLLGIAIAFSLWSFSDLVLWTNNDSRNIMFFWSSINLLEVLVSALTLYFVYIFLEKKDISFKIKLLIGSLLSIFIILIPTKLNIPSFILSICEARQGMMIKYFYFLEAFFSSWLIIYLIRKIKNSSKGDERKKTVCLSLGAVLFLLFFSGTNIYSSITTHWEILQYGLFGMVVFMAFLAYLIVKFKAFNIKLLASQALVMALVIIIGSELFFAESATNKILILITLALSLGFGYILVKSVKLEIRRKEELQMISDKLSQANDQLRKLDNAKSEFISIASHQLRTPLTAIKGYISLLLEGTYGRIESKARDALNKVYLSNERMMQLVENLLNISRIESGKLEFDFKKWKVEEILNELRDTFFISAKSKGLSLDFKFSGYPLPEIEIDGPKIKEVISNLIDNALKYTQEGGVSVTAEIPNSKSQTPESEFIRITVYDTGIGIPKEELPYLFAKFSRGKDTTRLHVGGTGLGLYVGRSMIEAHHGRIWAESEGEGKGSRFIVEIPVSRKEA